MSSTELNLAGLEAWRRSQHTFDKIPEKIRGQIRSNYLRIPDDATTPLPNQKMSVLDILGITLPSMPDGASGSHFIPGSTASFFSTDNPDQDCASMLATMTVPSRLVVAELVAGAAQQWLDGANSISIPGTETKFPLWVARVWSDLLTIVGPDIAQWKDSLTWLHRQEFRAFKDQVQKTAKSLSMLSWSGHMMMMPSTTSMLAAGNPASFPKNIIKIYLSRAWLNDDHIDQLVTLLAADISSSPDHSPFPRDTLLLDTITGRSIVQAFKDHASGKTLYDPGNREHFLARFGATISEQSRIGGIFNLNDNHWVVIVIDLKEHRFLYGDPAQPTASTPTEIYNALSWWIAQHLPSISLDDLKHTRLPCPDQRDSFNCGIFSFNALEHFFAPHHRHLLQHTDSPVYMDLARMDLLCRLVLRYNQIAPSDNSLPSTVFRTWKKQPTTDSDSASSLTPPVQRSHQDTIHALGLTENMINRMLLGKNADKVLKSVENTCTPKSSKKRAPTSSVQTKLGPKKRKTNSHSLGQSAIAPVFKKKPLGQKAGEYMADWNVKNPSSYPSSPLARHSKTSQDPLSDDADTDEASAAAASSSDSDESSNESTQAVTGRPTLNILDQLTVEIRSDSKNARRYKCIATGCPRQWQPRSQARVLAHSKHCVHLTKELRQVASKASADSSPGALVSAAAAKTKAKAAVTSGTPTPAGAQPSRKVDVSFFGSGAQRVLHQQLDLAVVKVICISRIPPAVVDTPEWKEMFSLQTPSYQPASRTKLMDSHIQSEASNVSQLQYDAARHTQNTISFDHGGVRGGSVLTINTTTSEKEVMLLEGQDCTNESHTGRYIADNVISVIEKVGAAHVDAVASDSTGNTSTAREIICARFPTVLNLPDPIHHLNNTTKDIAALEYFADTVQHIKQTIKQFSQSPRNKSLLKTEREARALGPGLESIGKTRFATVTWSAISLHRCLPAIRELCVTGQINLKEQNDLFVDRMESLQFEIKLTQFIAAGEGIARAIECLEATSTTPSDVYLYWLATIAHIKEQLETSKLPDSVCSEIRRIVNFRWQQFFVFGPTNVHKAAFYLHPSYVRSTIFKKPNALAFNITLPAKEPPKVPPGISHPKTFDEIGKYIYTLLEAEVKAGHIVHLRKWAGRRTAFAKAYQGEFTAFAQGSWPFTTPLLSGQSVLEWWRAFEGKETGGILAAIAIKLHSVGPHSMADERAMSAITMLNSALRNRQTVDSVISIAQVRGYYLRARQPETKLRKSAHPSPTIKFFDIERHLRTIDDDTERSTKESVNYDESDTEDSEDSVRPRTDHAADAPDTLPMDGDDAGEEIDLGSAELKEILADGPIQQSGPEKDHGPSTKAKEKALKEDDIDDFVDDDDFELGSWV